MRKHTPGPWNRGVSQNIYQGEKWDPSSQQRLIAQCEPTTRTQQDWEEVWANAVLIAAAPDMLEALEVAREYLYNPFEPDNQSRAWHTVCAAIVKAKGNL